MLYGRLSFACATQANISSNSKQMLLKIFCFPHFPIQSVRMSPLETAAYVDGSSLDFRTKLLCGINVSVMKICLGASRVPEVYTLVT